jgi:hypothetical protein
MIPYAASPVLGVGSAQATTLGSLGGGAIVMPYRLRCLHVDGPVADAVVVFEP